MAASSSANLRLYLVIAVAVALAAVIATTPVGYKALALLAQGVGALAAGSWGAAVTLAAAGAALVFAVLFVLHRRRRVSAMVLRRAFRSPPAQPPREPEPAKPVNARSAFLSVLQDRLRAHAEEGRQLAVHRIDLDRFRRINARFGSDIGDEVLNEVSRRLWTLAGDTAHLVRLGDDEFAVIQPETGGARHAEIFAARMQRALEEPIAAGATDIIVTASIGIAIAPEHGSEAERLLICADMALEKAKQVGHGAVHCFAAAMDERLERRRAVEEALGAALAEGPASLVLRYRPQYDLSRRRLIGFEVEVRLKDPGLGTVMEAELTPVALEIGLLPAVAERVAREACRAAARWPQHLRLGLNLLPAHCRGREMAKLLSEALKASHLSPGRVDLEVAEDIVSSGGEQAVKELRRLADVGFRLVLDHYGAGHCGPADLWREPFAAVKIDASLIGRIGQAEEVEPLVGAMIKFAQALGLEAIADGAERVEQVHFLMLNGCQHVAGPVLGAAVAAEKVAGLIDKDAKNAEGSEQASAAA